MSSQLSVLYNIMILLSDLIALLIERVIKKPNKRKLFRLKLLKLLII